MNRRTLTLVLSAVVFATALPQSGFAQTNLLVGTWKLNLEKSKFSPGPLPRSLTRTTEVVGQSFKSTFEGISAKGSPLKVVVGPYSYDEKVYPVTGTLDYDAASFKLVNNSTNEITLTKAGKTVQLNTGILSADGKTYIITNTGVRANGQQINNVAVYDKQ
jgi:hypothetical protein